MSITFVRVCFSSLAVAFLMSAFACVGPQGPPGPAGPPGSGGGPPYVWVCTPAHYPLVAGSIVAGNTVADLYVFNGGSATANIAVHILDKDGTNLSGITIPGREGDPAAIYPGQAGSTTVAVPSAHTLILQWLLPNIAAPNGIVGGPLVAASNQLANVSTTISVVSDQPIAVGSNFQLNGVHPIPCSLLPK